MYPTLFISHGAPNIVLGNSYSKNNIREFSKTLEKPKYIIIFSAHYVTSGLKMASYTTKDLMYDFYGFEKELYEFKYEISSDKDISLKVKEELEKQGLTIDIDDSRVEFDHGVWTTLSMMYENLDIPVIQLSIPYNYSPKQLIQLGEKLKVFKDEALIIGSGGLTHNLRDMSMSTTVKPYAQEFNDYILQSLEEGSEKKLLDIQDKAIFSKNHPSAEHFSPLNIVYGSAYNKKGSSFNHEITYSNISMESFIFDK